MRNEGEESRIGLKKQCRAHVGAGEMIENEREVYGSVRVGSGNLKRLW